MNYRRSLMYAVVFSMFYAFLYRNALVFLVYVLSSASLVILNRRVLFEVLFRKCSVYHVLAILVFASIPFIVLRNFSTPVYFLLTIWSILLATTFVCSANVLYFFYAIRALLYFYIFSVLSYLLFTHGKYPVGYHLDHMIGEAVSANGVTSFANVLLGVYTVFSLRLKKKGTLLASLLVLYISVEGYGRASIACSLVAILVNVIFYFYVFSGFKRLCVISLFVFFIGILSPFYYDVYRSTKFASGLETPRTVMLYEYVNNIDMEGMVFGGSYGGTLIESKYDNNPHNAYIRAHHILGVFYFIGLIYWVFCMFMKVLIRRDRIGIISFIVILSLLVRSATDPLFFPTLFDSFFFATVYMSSAKTGLMEV